MIRCIFFDVDDTLMDYRSAERQVLTRLMREQGAEPDEAALDDLWERSWFYWEARGLDHPERVAVHRDYHDRARLAVEDLCTYARIHYGLRDLPAQLSSRFVSLMGEAVTTYDDVPEALSALKDRYLLCAASNALSESQRPRLEKLGLLDHFFLSEAIGRIKPSRALFLRACTRLHVHPRECLMVGDSLMADVGGAAKAGLQTCWLNRAGRDNATRVRPHYTIRTLHELPPLLSRLRTMEGSENA